MSGSRPIPFPTLVFVCTHARPTGERIGCADASRCGDALWAEIKRRVTEKGWADRVRVSKSGCLDRCEEGPNAVVVSRTATPRWVSGLTPQNLDALLASLDPGA